MVMSRSCWIACGVAFVVAKVGLTLIAYKYGVVTPALAGVVFMGLAVWLGHTPESKAMAEDIDGARMDCAMSQKEFARHVGRSSSQVSNALAGREHFSAWLLAKLPPAFHVALAKRRIQRSGTHLVIERGLLADLIARVDAMTRRQKEVA